MDSAGSHWPAVRGRCKGFRRRLVTLNSVKRPQTKPAGHSWSGEPASSPAAQPFGTLCSPTSPVSRACSTRSHWEMAPLPSSWNQPHRAQRLPQIPALIRKRIRGTLSGGLTPHQVRTFLAGPKSPLCRGLSRGKSWEGGVHPGRVPGRLVPPSQPPAFNPQPGKGD